MKQILVTLVGWILISHVASAAPEAELLAHWAKSNQNSAVEVNHQVWQQFLNKYLVISGNQTLVQYSKVSKSDQNLLKSYIDSLIRLNPIELNKPQQKAYWINLYNALTVNTVLESYPVDSILDIKSSWIIPGPWRKNLINVSSMPLSLNDIEHGILRPIFKDPRVHYALNCASIGCPNLQPVAYQADYLNQQLDAAAIEFINSDKAYRKDGDKIILSSIYDWYMNDFGSGDQSISLHLKQYHVDFIDKFDNNAVIFDYDWTINEDSQ